MSYKIRYNGNDFIVTDEMINKSYKFDTIGDAIGFIIDNI